MSYNNDDCLNIPHNGQAGYCWCIKIDFQNCIAVKSLNHVCHIGHELFSHDVARPVFRLDLFKISYNIIWSSWLDPKSVGLIFLQREPQKSSWPCTTWQGCLWWMKDFQMELYVHSFGFYASPLPADVLMFSHICTPCKSAYNTLNILTIEFVILPH